MTVRGSRDALLESEGAGGLCGDRSKRVFGSGWQFEWVSRWGDERQMQCMAGQLSLPGPG